MTATITTPNPEQEHPRLGVSITIALVCFAVGAAAVVTIAEPASPRPATHTAARSLHSQTTTPAAAAPAASRQSSAPAARTEAALDAARLVATSANDGSTSAPARTQDQGALTLIQGRVAYLRCDGLTGERGRSPCPRDANFEHLVWEVLSALPNCSPTLGRGTADVRLDLSRNGPTETRVIAVAGSPEPSLDTQRVYACVGRKLTKLTTSLDPIYMMVSFRIALH